MATATGLDDHVPKGYIIPRRSRHNINRISLSKSKKQNSLIPEAPPLVRGGSPPFTLDLKELHDTRLDKYLQKYVIIKYWQNYPDIFEGEISCIGSKMQIRLQNIHSLYTKQSSLPSKWHHSYWFHFKNIKSIHYNDEDITDEIMDIMKYRMIQSFLFYCMKQYNYERRTQYIEYLENENVTKILTKLSEDPSNYELYLECNIASILKMALKQPSKQCNSNSFNRTLKRFLYDLNRINRHLLLKREFKNKQRIVSCFETSEILCILNNYKELLIKYVKRLYGINKRNIKRYKEHIQEQFFDEKKEEDAPWPSYIDWDTKTVQNTLQKWKLYKRNKDTRYLYNTTSWNNDPTHIDRKITIYRHRIRKRHRRAKNDGLDNRWKSQHLDHYFKNRHTNPLHHGKKFKRMKKLHKKRNRIETEKETIFRMNES